MMLASLGWPCGCCDILCLIVDMWTRGAVGGLAVPWFSHSSVGVWYTVIMHKMTRDEVVALILEIWGEVNDRNNDVLDRLERRSTYGDEQEHLELSAASGVLRRLMMEIRQREGA